VAIVAKSMKNTKKFASLLQYILGRRPDEFGLWPNSEGYVALKDFLKVLHEEKWHHLRPNHLETWLYSVPEVGIEINGRLIRARERRRLPLISTGGKLPKQLYTCIRRKAYAATAENGLGPQGGSGKVLLFSNIELARRVGRRRDADPVVVTVQTTVAQRFGIQFARFGEALYLAPRIPAEGCRLPAAPKTIRAAKTRHAAPPADPPPAGSFILDWKRLTPSMTSLKTSGRKSKQWRRERQRLHHLKRSPEDVD
jgi:putative RNA 2'-phosphotransferase